LKVLPPDVYQGDWREMKAHVTPCSAPPAVLHALQQPVAYGRIFSPSRFANSPRHENFEAVKESSTDARPRLPIRALLWTAGWRFLSGVDDAVLEAIGVERGDRRLANALPGNLSILLNCAMTGDSDKALNSIAGSCPASNGYRTEIRAAH